uniref:Cache domain containing 1 n=1 Tax=Eptatretus burgeri TaxID=7764 RepID=A0A8C4QBV0_EPTBU
MSNTSAACFLLLGFFTTFILLVAAESQEARSLASLLSADSRQAGSLLPAASTLAGRLRSIADHDLGVLNMQEMYNSFKYEEKITDVEADVQKLSRQIESKFSRYLAALSRNKQAVEAAYTAHLSSPLTIAHACCSLPTTMLSYDASFGANISRSFSCDRASVATTGAAFSPGRELDTVLGKNLETLPGLRWQFYSSEEGIFTVFPAVHLKCQRPFEHRSRWVYAGTARPRPKLVVLVLDVGRDTAESQLRVGRGAAEAVLSTLGHRDYVGVLLAADEARPCPVDSCYYRLLAPATAASRAALSSYLGTARTSTIPTSHSAAFRTAFKLIAATHAELAPRHASHHSKGFGGAVVVYISPGVASKEERRQTMAVIAAENMALNQSVMILTFALLNEATMGIRELAFLRDLAEQNSARLFHHSASPIAVPGRLAALVPHQSDSRFPSPVWGGSWPSRTASLAPKGTMMVLNSLSNLETTVGRFYTNFPNEMEDLTIISPPRKDDISGGLALTLSRPCFFGNVLLGVVGVVVALADALEPISYFPAASNSYAFLIDTKGFVIFHPSFPRLSQLEQPLPHTHIDHFESIPGFGLVRFDMLSLPIGSRELSVAKEAALSWHHTRIQRPNLAYTIRYAWKLLADVEMVACVAVVEPDIPIRHLTSRSSVGSAKLLYHRLDLLVQSRLCRHFQQLSTLDSSTVMLSAGGFSEPNQHLRTAETKRVAENYAAYLSDGTRLFANPGLRPGVRADVVATGLVTRSWPSLAVEGTLQSYVVRRYVATPGGVLRIFPGTLVAAGQDPQRQQWYQQAVANPGKITLSGPFLDAGGAGYIITLSHTIHAPSSEVTPPGQVIAVMAMDLTLRFFYRLLSIAVPACRAQGPGNKIRCFIMEDRGYLVAHPTLVDPHGDGPVEQQHLTHKEPLVANDILSHPGFVKKQLCNRLGDRTIQRSYRFNTSLPGELSNLLHGSHCSRYLLAHLPGSNAFVAVVNESCEALAFCACSMVDRLCLNCHRMEQSECECPCECSLDIDDCSGNVTSHEDSNPSCDAPFEPLTLASVDSNLLANLPACFNPRCSPRQVESDCFGVLGCEWCVLESDGTSLLAHPYCAPLHECFGGVVGAALPYAQSRGRLRAQATLPSRLVPVGPVAGGVMGAVVVAALAVYACRHHRQRQQLHHMAPLATQELSVRMSHIENDRDEATTENRRIIGHTRFIAAVMERRAQSTERRRRYWARSGTDSDHGYSTMSPQEDSETTCCASDPPALLRIGVTRHPTSILPGPPSYDDLFGGSVIGAGGRTMGMIPGFGPEEEDLCSDALPQTAALLNAGPVGRITGCSGVTRSPLCLPQTALRQGHSLQAAVTVHAEC